MRQFKRSERLSVQMQRDIARLLESELADRVPGMVTFTHVRLSDDLRHARVYYSYLGQASDRAMIEEYLMRERGRLRSLVGRSLRIRHIPELDFKFDPSVETGVRIEQLLEEIKRDHSDHTND
ncbi:MAG: 30S ribosome-binding factor RbfA [Candidatus Zixiibacteriota bacterium]